MNSLENEEENDFITGIQYSVHLLGSVVLGGQFFAFASVNFMDFMDSSI